MQRTLLLVVLTLFSVLTAVAVWNHGYWGIIEPNFKTFDAGSLWPLLCLLYLLYQLSQPRQPAA